MSSKSEKPERVVISRPNLMENTFHIIGTSPLVMNRFSKRAIQKIYNDQSLGSLKTKGRKKEAKDFVKIFNDARYISEDGWDGVPAHIFRNAAVGVCRLVGFKMTLAKLSIFCIGEGRTPDDYTELVRIISDEPTMDVRPGRNQTGVTDLRSRPMYKNWEMNVTMRWDADQFSLEDMGNLMLRIGMQGGLGDGRHNSFKSSGVGWGCFTLAEDKQKKAA